METSSENNLEQTN